jgi:hypothetical protein
MLAYVVTTQIPRSCSTASNQRIIYEFGRNWKATFLAAAKYCHSKSIEGLRKTTKPLSGQSVSKLNLGPLETKAAVLNATTWYIYSYVCVYIQGAAN